MTTLKEFENRFNVLINNIYNLTEDEMRELNHIKNILQK